MYHRDKEKAYYLVERKPLEQGKQNRGKPALAHSIIIMDCSGSMYGAIAELKQNLTKLFTLDEYLNTQLIITLISYASHGDVICHFQRIPISEIMKTNSPYLQEIDQITTRGYTCISQSLDIAKILSRQQLEYAQMDTVYLAKVHQKLLQLLPETEVNPDQDNLEAITKRYRQIELQWKLLNSEIEHLKERAKKAMAAQNITENSTFKLSSYDRTTVKANLIELSQIIVDMELEEKIDITLTKEVQKQLEEVLKNINLEEEKTKVLTLKIKPNEDEPDFNF